MAQNQGFSGKKDEIEMTSEKFKYLAVIGCTRLDMTSGQEIRQEFAAQDGKL
jgi:hypothetical protein